MTLAIPRDPLATFIAIVEALKEQQRWFDDRTILRYAALPLIVAKDDPKTLAARVAAGGKTLAESAGWLNDLRGSMRYVLAALAVTADTDPHDLARALEAIQARFREVGVRRGGAYESIAAAMLHFAGKDSPSDVLRMQRIYVAMREHHWWLTGPGDLPACALLTVHGGDVLAMTSRIEAMYTRLREHGLSASDGLQLASHVLCLAPGTVPEATNRMLDLYEGFKAKGIQMWDSDRDELAVLCLLGDEPAKLVELVVDHRARIKEQLSFVGPVTSFSYACGTAFLAARAGQRLVDPLAQTVQVANLVQAVNAVLVMQQRRQAASS